MHLLAVSNTFLEIEEQYPYIHQAACLLWGCENAAVDTDAKFNVSN